MKDTVFCHNDPELSELKQQFLVFISLMDKTDNIKIGNKFLHIVVKFRNLEMTLTNQEHEALKSYKQTEFGKCLLPFYPECFVWAVQCLRM